MGVGGMGGRGWAQSGGMRGVISTKSVPYDTLTWLLSGLSLSVCLTVSPPLSLSLEGKGGGCKGRDRGGYFSVTTGAL